MASYVPAVLIALLMFSHVMDAMASDDLGFFFFVLMWPGGFCKLSSEGCCDPKVGEPISDFFARGLLPYSNNGTALTNCSKCTFHLDEVSDMMGDLYSYWSDISCPSADSINLWKFTWETYGVCSGLTQHDYFNKSLDILKEIDMLKRLEKYNIIPIEYHDYPVREIMEAIEAEFNVTATIECSSNSVADYQLYKIYLCLDKDLTKLISCPVPAPEEIEYCPEYIAFSPYTPQNETSMAANPIRMSTVPE
ncbi:hypothetical protein HHK36_026491 [Tetracentron sinense]|uniref:Uncharacterized protein n=1 Tax=Tetracentron sinense TaxID=13715 RepID=A0A834YGX5_TETSI|nr:hypothetical protein HHK36_026491 [Tetracentron sinense]